MTPQPLSSAARAGEASENRRPAPQRASNKGSPDADAPDFVVVRDGQILCWTDGIFGPTAPLTAWCEWFALSDSPHPASRRRAAALRKALDQIGYLQ